MSEHTDNHGHDHGTKKGETFFEESTIAVGFLYTIAAIAALCALIFL
jgi:hypothetical protein